MRCLQEADRRGRVNGEPCFSWLLLQLPQGRADGEASSSEDGVGGDEPEPPLLHGHLQPLCLVSSATSAEQLFRGNPEGGGRVSNKQRSWNVCGIHYWNLATQRASLSPRGWDGGGVLLESVWRPWAGAMDGGVSKNLFPSPMAELLGPCFPYLQPVLPLRTAGRNHVPGFPLPPHSPAGEGDLASSAPATYGLLFCCSGLAVAAGA